MSASSRSDALTILPSRSSELQRAEELHRIALECGPVGEFLEELESEARSVLGKRGRHCHAKRIDVIPRLRFFRRDRWSRPGRRLSSLVPREPDLPGHRARKRL